MLARRGNSRTLLFSVFVSFLIILYYFWCTIHFPSLQSDHNLLTNGSLSSTNQQTSHLRQLCERTEWTAGLWIQCHSNARKDIEGKRSVHGGLNNVRNRLQSCLRVAIDAGAGVIIPSIATRNQTFLKNLGGGEPVPASQYWNTEHMVDVLRTECPQLKVRFDWKGISRKVDSPKRSYKHGRYLNGTFREMAFSILRKENIQNESITPDNPVAISFGDTFMAWDYEMAGELSTIRLDLFRTLDYNQTLLNIGFQILKSPQLQHGFIGIHLRAEKDWPWGFGNAGDQMRLYIEEIERLPRKYPSSQRTLYVSCGLQEGIQAFRDMVVPLGYEVHDKWTLLAQDPETLAIIEGLMFDEKAAVEYQMLLNSDFFLGPVMSSMSSLIAFTRALDKPGDFFQTYIFPGSTKDVGEDGWGLRRTYPQVPVMRGDEKSRLMVVNGDDIMSAFP